MNLLQSIDHSSRAIAVKTIRIYQKTLSFDHGLPRFLYPHGYCKFKPTCSEYAIGAMTSFGLLRGGALTAWRVLRCHPFSKGGADPINKKK